MIPRERVLIGMCLGFEVLIRLFRVRNEVGLAEKAEEAAVLVLGENGWRWDSGISNPAGKVRAGDVGAVVHTQARREFVVFSGDQIYPEYLVRFKTV